MKKLWLILLAFTPLMVFAQEEVDVDIDVDVEIEEYDEIEEPVEGEEAFEVFDVAEKAEFKGGQEELYKYLGSNLEYPPVALEDSIAGTVILLFVVEKDGTIKEISVVSKKLGYGLEEEAIRVIKSTSGMWTAAKQRDKNVRMRYRLPVKFVIF